MVDPAATRHRDLLLRIAISVVSQARQDEVDPGVISHSLHAAWCRVTGPPTRIDDDFWPDPDTGVEALAFVVGASPASARGGLLLRLPGELPDSFESMDPSCGDALSPAGLRRTYFGDPVGP